MAAAAGDKDARVDEEEEGVGDTSVMVTFSDFGGMAIEVVAAAATADCATVARGGRSFFFEDSEVLGGISGGGINAGVTLIEAVVVVVVAVTEAAVVVEGVAAATLAAATEGARAGTCAAAASDSIEAGTVCISVVGNASWAPHSRITRTISKLAICCRARNSSMLLVAK
jgi:hypothetical protein